MRRAVVRRNIELTYGQPISISGPVKLAYRASSRETSTARHGTKFVIRADKAIARHNARIRKSAANRDIAGSVGRYKLKRLQKKRAKLLARSR